MKLLSMELMSDAEGNLIVPSISLRGLESDSPFTFQICMNAEEESEEGSLCIPQMLLEEAGIDPFAGLHVMTGEGIVAICPTNQCDITRIITGGK